VVRSDPGLYLTKCSQQPLRSAGVGGVAKHHQRSATLRGRAARVAAGTVQGPDLGGVGVDLAEKRSKIRLGAGVAGMEPNQLRGNLI
jgi:hypothetical protein